MTTWGTKITERSLSAAKVQIWADTVEKEERAFLKGLEDYGTSRPSRRDSLKHQRRKREHRHRSKEDSEERQRLRRSASAGATPSHCSLATSAQTRSSRTSGSSSWASSQLSSSSSRSRGSHSRLPEDMHALSCFSLTESPIVALRPLDGPHGRIPKVRHRTVTMPAHWVPNTQSVTTYEPEFYFEEPRY